MTKLFASHGYSRKTNSSLLTFFIKFVILFTPSIVANATTSTQCYCDELPKGEIDGFLTHIPATQAAGWVTFVQDFESNRTKSFRFSSQNVSCSLEMKVMTINTSSPFFFFSTGRGPFDIRTTFVGLSQYLTCCRAGEMEIDRSLISSGSLIALVIPKLTTRTPTTASFSLSIRQHCNLASLPSHGVDIDAHTEPRLFRFGLDGYSHVRHWYVGSQRVKRRWNFRPPEGVKCSVAVQIIKLVGDTSLIVMHNDQPIYLGVVYKTGIYEPFRLAITGPADRGFVEVFEMRYYTVCDAAASERFSFDVPADRILRATPGEQLQIVNVFVNVTSWGHFLIWRLSAPVGDNESYILEPEGLSGNLSYTLSIPRELSLGIPTFESRGRLFGVYLNQPGAFGEFRFRFRAFRPARQTVYVNSTSEWSNITGNNLNRLTELRFIAVGALDDICFVRGKLTEVSSHIVIIRAHPFGLLGVAHEGYSKARQEVALLKEGREVTSKGSFLIIFADVTAGNGTFHYTMSYKSECPPQLPLATTDWTRVMLPPDASCILLAPKATNMSTCVHELTLASSSFYQRKDIRVTCMDGKWTTVPISRAIYLANCSKGAIIIQSNGVSLLKTEFSFRLNCPLANVSVSPFTSPIAGALIKATGIWRPLTANTGLSSFGNTEGWRAWTVRPANHKCYLQLELRRLVDLTKIQITEDYSSLAKGYHLEFDDDDYNIQTFGASAVISDEFVDKFPRKLSYASCTNNMYIQLPETDWFFPEYESATESLPHILQYEANVRQVCPGEESSKQWCSTLNEFRATKAWKSVAFFARNFNQVKNSVFFISNDETEMPTSTAAIEVQFLSLAQQNMAFTRYGGDRGDVLRSMSGFRGVYIHGSKPATTGRSFVFPHEKNVSITSDVFAQGGDQVFRLRYRLRNFSDAIEEHDDGLVLTATDTPKKLKFKVPKQYSEERRRQILKHELDDVIDDYSNEDYGDRGIISAWMYKYVWTIKPGGGPQCRIVLKFTKIDIGSGHLVPVYTNFQHRLMVQEQAAAFTGNSSSNSFTGVCSHDRDEDNVGIVCARLDQVYVSTPRTSFKIAFQSSQVGTEYENSGPSSEWKASGIRTGAESTWGSGWTAVYYQDCSNGSRTNVSERLLPIIVVKATDMWQTSLPGRPADSSLVLFRNLQWKVVPSKVACTVELLLTHGCRNHRHQKDSVDHCQSPASQRLDDFPFQVRSANGSRISHDATWNIRSQHFSEGSHLTLLMLGQRPGYEVKVRFRQKCV